MTMALVTGGAGFIGSHLCEALAEKRYAVQAFDNLSVGDGNVRLLKAKGISCITGDVARYDEVKQAVKKADIVFHLACVNRAQRNIQFPVESFHANSVGTFNVLEAARISEVDKVVFVSSSSVYGNAPGVKREDQKPEPVHNYGVSKVVGEMYASIYMSLYGLKSVTLRYFSVYGPRQRGDIDYAAVIPKFITLLSRNQPLPIYGDGEQKRCFTYVSDTVGATIDAAETDKAVGETINISTTEETSINALGDLLGTIMKKKAKKVYAKPLLADARSNQADTSKAKTLLGWQAQTNLEAGLRKTVEAYETGSSR